MQTAGYLVSSAAELASGMQHRQAHFHRRPAHLRVQTHREAAAVVHNRHAAVRVDRHVDLVAVPCQRLVNGVVHNFIYQVMKPPGVRGADIHAGPFPNGLQPFQHLNLFLAVVLGHGRHLFQIRVKFFCHDTPRSALLFCCGKPCRKRSFFRLF